MTLLKKYSLCSKSGLHEWGNVGRSVGRTGGKLVATIADRCHRKDKQKIAKSLLHTVNKNFNLQCCAFIFILIICNFVVEAEEE